MIYNYTFIYFNPYIYIDIIMYCRPTVKLELLAPSYLTNWSNMAVPRRHVLRHPRWLPSGQRRPAVRGAVRGPSSAITAIRCINMYMYTCMWIFFLYNIKIHAYIYISGTPRDHFPGIKHILCKMMISVSKLRISSKKSWDAATPIKYSISSNIPYK